MTDHEQKILIVDDEPTIRQLLHQKLSKQGYHCEEASSSDETLDKMRTYSADLIMLDIKMPGKSGMDLLPELKVNYPATAVIMATAVAEANIAIQCVKLGADDYITKPFNREELRARVQAGIRVLELQGALAQRVRELEEALSRVKTLQGLLPICSYCKKIRDDRNYWQQVEGYISDHSQAQFSHGICPECYARFVQPELDRLHVQAGKVP